MTRKALAVLLVLALVGALGLSACSNAENTTMQDESYDQSIEMYDKMNGLAAATTAAPSYESATMERSEVGYSAVVDMTKSETAVSDKIIYTANVTLETQEYEKTVQELKDLLASLGGYIQSESQTGSSYGRTENRYGTFTLRVPQEHFQTLMDGVAGLGNVPYSAASQQNVTTTYVDTEAKLRSLRVQEERLLAMLQKAENVEEMLIIESHLQEVRYQIESATSTLQNIDRQVAYSTIDLSVREVSEYSTAAPKVQSYWEQVWGDLLDAFRGIGDFLKNTLRFVIVMMPAVLLILVVLVPAILIWKKKRKDHVGRRRLRSDRADEGPEQTEE